VCLRLSCFSCSNHDTKHQHKRPSPPPPSNTHQRPERTAAQLMTQTPEDELDERAREVAWGAAMCGLTITRYLTEHVASLPLGVMGRLVSANDTIMALLPLVDQPPWQRTRKGELERFTEGRWQVVAPADRLKVSQPDAQVWLALHNLLLEPSCRCGGLGAVDHSICLCLEVSHHYQHQPTNQPTNTPLSKVQTNPTNTTPTQSQVRP